MPELLNAFVAAEPNQARLVRLPASAQAVLDSAFADPGLYSRAKPNETRLLQVGEQARRDNAVPAAQLYACLETLWFLAWESEEGDRHLETFEVIPL